MSARKSSNHSVKPGPREALGMRNVKPNVLKGQQGSVTCDKSKAVVVDGRELFFTAFDHAEPVGFEPDDVVADTDLYSGLSER